MSRNIFITGTGTDVGKTYVTGLIVKKLKESGADAAYYKAAMSGNERRPDGSLIPGDALQVKTMSGIPSAAGGDVSVRSDDDGNVSPASGIAAGGKSGPDGNGTGKSSMKSVKNTNM